MDKQPKRENSSASHWKEQNGPAEPILKHDLEEFMWVNQWLHTAEKLNLKPKTGESLPAPAKHLLPFQQHRLDASPTDPLWDEE